MAMLWDFYAGGEDEAAAKEVQKLLRLVSSRLADLSATAFAQGLATRISDAVLLLTLETDIDTAPVAKERRRPSCKN
jgi:enhancing lycopene biosynthesis protein 2